MIVVIPAGAGQCLVLRIVIIVGMRENMERADLLLYQRIHEALEDYGLDYILETNELTYEDVVFHLIRSYGLELPQ